MKKSRSAGAKSQVKTFKNIVRKKTFSKPHDVDRAVLK